MDVNIRLLVDSMSCDELSKIGKYTGQCFSTF